MSDIKITRDSVYMDGKKMMSRRSLEKLLEENKQKDIKTVVTFILDKSGSMESIRDSVIDGFNEYVSGLKKGNKNIEFSLTLFDSDDIEKRHISVPIDSVTKMNRDNYVPGSMTPLYDAVCQTVKEVEKKLAGRNDYASVVVIMTDGMENFSQEFTSNDLANLRKRLEDSGSWSFVYMGANQDAWQTAQQWGFSKGNTLTWASTAKGTESVFRSLSNSTVMMAASASNGTKKTDNFFNGTK